MTTLDQALSLAARGFHVFPCRKNDKRPVKVGWQELATRDPAAIRKMWGSRAYNIGISTSHFGEHQALVVVDVDVKKGKRGDETLLQLELEGNEFPLTAEHSTPSGGRHLIYVTDEALNQGLADVLGHGIDIRSRGGYIVGPGSTLDGKAYAQINGHGTLAPAPDWLVARLGVDRARPAVHRDPLPGVDRDRALERAGAYLETAPGATLGSRGSTAYKVAARLKDFGCTEADALALMNAFWAEKCQPEMPAEDLEESVNHAFRYGREVPGSSAPEAVFPAAPQEEEDPGVHPLDELNRSHAFVVVGGQGQVLWDTTDETGQPTTKLLSVPTFHQLYQSKVFQAGGRRTEQLTNAWMAWPKRRTYEKLVLAPGQELPARFYNLWRGFSVTPAPGDWSRLRSHIREVVCSGQPELDRYVMGWLAMAIQRPGVRAEVALVLRGGKGVGKGILGNALCHLFGRHAQHLANAKHLVGAFNGHLRETVFIFADESFWAGDRQHESTLKAIVTEPQFMLEAKGRDGEMWPNRLHLLMASNDEWVVPASADERRFCVLDVPPIRQQDTAYFGAIVRQLEAGGYEAMLHDLLAWDLSSYEIREIPKTQALMDQKLSSLRGPERWFFDMLTEGSICGHRWEEPGGLTVPKAEAYAHYADLSRRVYGERYPKNDKVFWKTVLAILRAGRISFEEQRPTTGISRARSAVFPSLKAVRAAFERYIRGTVEWPVQLE